MLSLKKYSRRYLALLALVPALSCGPSRLHNTRIEGKKIPVSADVQSVPEIDNFLKPYREHIDKDLDNVLAYCPETMDKSKSIKGWQTTIGNFMAKVTFDAADKVLFQREKLHVDGVLLNHGGIRSIIAKGNVTARTAFEIMPFENALVVVALKGEQVREIADYMSKEKKPHPLEGIAIVLDAAGAVKRVTIQGKTVEDSRIYYIATSDYLSNGGDNMEFFKKGVKTYDLNYKLRNIFIDYFKEVDTLPIITTQKVTVE